MSIIYYDKKNEQHGCVFGSTPQEKQYWNPDGEYSDNEYIKVYFRIETPSYYKANFGVGFATDTDRENYGKEIAELFKRMDWMDDTTVFFGTGFIVKGKARLYLHPQDVSGIVLKKDVKAIAEALKDNKYFTIRWVDLYEDVYDMTDERYTAYLETQKDKIKGLLLTTCKTKRRNLFKDCGAVAYNLTDKVRLHRVSDKGDYYGERAFTANYIISVVDDLIEQGYLVQANRTDIKLIRTINKTEQKEKKLFITDDMEVA